MPTISEYSDESGYYIRAWTSDAGNITYKLEEEAYPIIWQYGLRDGDEVAWSTIQSLKELGFIYTDQSGTLSPDDFSPDPDKLQKTELLPDDAERLYSLLTSRLDLSAAEKADLRGTLGISSYRLEISEVATRLEQRLPDRQAVQELTVRMAGVDVAAEDLRIEVGTTELDQDEYDRTNLGIWMLGGPENGNGIHHCIHLCERHGLEKWHVRVGEEPTWESKASVVEQQSVFLPELLALLPSKRYAAGDPSDTMSPNISNMTD